LSHVSSPFCSLFLWSWFGLGKPVVCFLLVMLPAIAGMTGPPHGQFLLLR
jgi:hypothetical protein